ncbi:MAG: tetratricopeptide repeat protein [Pseudomonadota bacterium]|nr:tetratricopeptide repeat protein [Pseudomonadota bacterium]
MRRSPAVSVAGAALLGLLVAVGLRATAVSRGVATAQRALDASDLEGAEAAWRQVLAADPGRAEALYGLGWTLHLAAETEAAREAFQQCVDAHPESPLGYKGLGSVAMAEGNPNLARRRFEEALAKAPNDVAVRHSLALLDLSTGRVAAAAAAFEALAAEEPTRAVFRQALAEALVADGKPEAALDAATEAVRLARDDPRGRALAEVTRARAILAATSGRVDPTDCAGTAVPVYTWLAEADRALDEAEATGVPLPELVSSRRAVRHRRGAIDDQCPGARLPTGPPAATALGRKFPDG